MGKGCVMGQGGSGNLEVSVEAVTNKSTVTFTADAASVYIVTGVSGATGMPTGVFKIDCLKSEELVRPDGGRVRCSVSGNVVTVQESFSYSMGVSIVKVK